MKVRFSEISASESRQAMSMIDRSLDGMAALSGHLGVALRRRLRELVGIALISLAMMAGTFARQLVGAGPFAEPRHRRAGA